MVSDRATFTDTHLARMARHLCLVMERMFNDPGLSRLRRSSPSHPAVDRFDLLSHFLSDESILRYPDDEEIVRALAAIQLDQNEWPVALEGNDFWSFLPSEEARRFVLTRLPDSALFPDLMAELSVWLKLRARGLAADFLETDGFPDIVINDGANWQVFAEVKHIHETTKLDRINQAIKKANRQIRAADPEGSGILFLKLSSNLLGAAYLDEVPSDVRSVIAEVERRLHYKQFRHISHAVVIWDTMDVIGDPPETSFRFLRRSTVVEHPAPYFTPTLDIDSVLIESSTEVLVRSSPSEESRLPLRTARSRQIVRSPGFKQFLDEVGTVRASHVVGALQDPDQQEIYRLDGPAWILSTKRVGTTRHPFTLLVISGGTDAGEIHPHQAFRLYERSEHDRRLADEPFQAFLELIHRFGVPVKVGDIEAAFIPHYSTDQNPIMGIPTTDDPDDRTEAMGVFRLRDVADGRQVFDVQWAYAIDLRKYVNELRAYSR